jgi:hypothetical protein
MVILFAQQKTRIVLLLIPSYGALNGNNEKYGRRKGGKEGEME